jgi:hypothetical protein
VSLRDDIRWAIHGAAAGQPLTPALERDVGMAVRSRLEQLGLGGWHVAVRRIGPDLEVTIDPPPQTPHVERIVVRVGPG